MAKAKSAVEFPISDVRLALAGWAFKKADNFTVKKAQDVIDKITEDEDEISRLEAETKKNKDKESKEIQNEILGAIDDEEEIVVVEDEDEDEDEDDAEESDEAEDDDSDEDDDDAESDDDSDEDEESDDDEDETPAKKKASGKKASGKKAPASKVERDAFGTSTNAGSHTINKVLFTLVDGKALSKDKIDEKAEALGKKGLPAPRQSASYLRWLVERNLLQKKEGKYSLTKLGEKVAAGKASEPEREPRPSKPAKAESSGNGKKSAPKEEKPAKKGGKEKVAAGKAGKKGRK